MTHDTRVHPVQTESRPRRHWTLETTWGSLQFTTKRGSFRNLIPLPDFPQPPHPVTQLHMGWWPTVYEAVASPPPDPMTKWCSPRSVVGMRIPRGTNRTARCPVHKKPARHSLLLEKGAACHCATLFHPNICTLGSIRHQAYLEVWLQCS